MVVEPFATWPSSTKKAAPAVDPSDRKFYLMGASKAGGKEALSTFDASLKDQQARSAAAGGSSDAIRETQSQLNALGFNAGGVDGVAGAKTDTAIRAFQAANGLTVDGIIGPQTRQALAASNAAPAPVTALNQTINNPLDDLPSPSTPGSPRVPGIPNNPGIPGFVLPDNHLGPVESPVIENPDYNLAGWDEGYVDFDNDGLIHDGKLNLGRISTRANELYAEWDSGAYGPGGVDLPNVAVQISDASNGGDALRLDIGPEAAIPLAGADTSRNDNGDKVLEVFIPVGPGTVTYQSDDPVGTFVGPIAEVLPINEDAIHPLNLTNIVTGGRWDPPTEQLEGLASALNPDSD